ncbi:ATP synthase F0 sector subunit b [hydrothermal vent metagenome]|uniref:ATP synthase F0 sector subunit b n=1 Tax=hydrothermal vent metagenome TaxID=652676 RepID=A0A3B0ZKK7_9ZZZZ
MNINVTLIAQIIAFVTLLWFVNRVLWNPMNDLLLARQKRIADGLAAADKGKHDLELAEKRAKEHLVEAKSQAAEIMAQAEKRGNEIVEEAKEKARTEGDRLITAAKAEIEQEANRAKEHLRGKVASIAAAGAGRILGREVDEKAHAGLLKDLVSQI